jgi:hypothetical protein
MAKNEAQQVQELAKQLEESTNERLDAFNAIVSNFVKYRNRAMEAVEFEVFISETRQMGRKLDQMAACLEEAINLTHDACVQAEEQTR